MQETIIVILNRTTGLEYKIYSYNSYMHTACGGQA